MGIQPQPTEFGNDCLACFSAGETPKWLKCFFAGIERGNNWFPAAGEPPNGYHDLLQKPGSPCTWNDDPPVFPSVTYTISGANSFLSCRTSIPVTAFISNPAVGCVQGFSNNFSTPVGNIFYGGWGHVITSIQIASIIELVTPLADPNPRMEYFPVSATQAVVRYAGKRDSTLVCMLVDSP